MKPRAQNQANGENDAGVELKLMDFPFCHQPAAQEHIGEQNDGCSGNGKAINQFERPHALAAALLQKGLAAERNLIEKLSARNRYLWADDLRPGSGITHDRENGHRTWKEWQRRFWLQECNATSRQWQ